MRLRNGLVMLGLGTLAACHADVKRTDASEDDRSVHIAMDGQGGDDHVSVNLPGIDAKVALPAIDLGRHVDLDGMRLAPDTKVGGIDVNGEGRNGQVRLRFTNPQPPKALIDYYRRAAADAGYADVSVGPDTLRAMKSGKSFALSVTPQGKGSAGTITMRGAD